MDVSASACCSLRQKEPKMLRTSDSRFDLRIAFAARNPSRSREGMNTGFAKQATDSFCEYILLGCVAQEDVKLLLFEL